MDVPDQGYTIDEVSEGAETATIKTAWKYSSGPVIKIFELGKENGIFKIDSIKLYIWNDFNDVASKMKNTGAETGIKPGQETAGLDQKKDFICENWSADNSIFNPPEDKNFKDVTEEMQEAVQGVGSSGLENAKQQICDSCQNAPTQELIDACLESAQCGQ